MLRTGKKDAAAHADRPGVDPVCVSNDDHPCPMKTRDRFEDRGLRRAITDNRHDGDVAVIRTQLLIETVGETLNR
jgi:hypothetical protein